MKAAEANKIASTKQPVHLEAVYDLIKYSAEQKRFYCWIVGEIISAEDLKQLRNDGYIVTIDDKGDYKILW